MKVGENDHFLLGSGKAIRGKLAVQLKRNNTHPKMVACQPSDLGNIWKYDIMCPRHLVIPPDKMFQVCLGGSKYLLTRCLEAKGYDYVSSKGNIFWVCRGW